MTNYIIERADGYCYKIASPKSAAELLGDLRKSYIKNDNIFSTFTPHVNRIPVAIYAEILRDHTNE